MRLATLPLLMLLGLVGVASQPAYAANPPESAPAHEVVSHKDIAYYQGDEFDSEKHRLDLFLPKGKKDFPVLFFVHGGAWVWGDRKLYGAFGYTLAKNGIGAVVTSYRLSPAVQHPAHIQDVARAFAWTCRNIGKYGGKVDEIFVCGHSAGGHLVALLATDDSYLKAEKLDVGNIRGAIPMSGVYAISTNVFFNRVFGSDEEVCRKASPLHRINGRHPPFLIIYADKDFPTCDSTSEKFCSTLKEHKCEACTLKVNDRNHTSIMVLCALNDQDPTTQAIINYIHKLGRPE